MTTEGLFAGYGKVLAALRHEAGMTQRELGSAIGVHADIISRYEREVIDPGVAQLGAMLAALGKTPRDFVNALHPPPQDDFRLRELGDAIAAFVDARLPGR